MLAACLPFGPVFTSNDTFWFSCSVLKPSTRISEKWANRSSPPPSGGMKPKPFASLNHLTEPVSIFRIPKERLKTRPKPGVHENQGRVIGQPKYLGGEPRKTNSHSPLEILRKSL